MEIKLKQQTPLIHFQHDQEGATLRATEVKAKLDKFILLKKERKPPAHWIQNKEKSDQIALAYKVKIIAPNPETPKEIPDGYPGFFGNIKQENPKKFTYTDSTITVSIFSFHEDLQKFISDHHREFFLYNNFGTRQSKGFGCFLPNDTNFPANFYHFDVASKDHRILFASIDLLYKTLRGGINGIAHPNPGDNKHKGFVGKFYLKPMIFQYAASKNIRWEKRAIKEAYFSEIKEKDGAKRNGRLKEDLEKQVEYPDFEPSPLFYEGGTAKIVRDWLGLSTDQEWKGYPEEGKSTNIKKVHIDTNNVEIQGEAAIARMKSPLLFKPVQTSAGFRVYFCANQDPKVRQTFKQSRFKIKSGSEDKLKLEVWPDFDLDKFLEFAFQDGRIESSIRLPGVDEAKETAIKEEIIRIYTEIRDSKPNKNAK